MGLKSIPALQRELTGGFESPSFRWSDVLLRAAYLPAETLFGLLGWLKSAAHFARLGPFPML